MVFNKQNWSLGEQRLSRRNLIKSAAVGAGAVAAVTTLGVTATPAGATTTSVPSYVKPSRGGVEIKAILTVGDLSAINGYRMVGIPDGLGAFSNGDGTFTLLMNHELRSGTGIKRAHGASGAFVSRWKIDADTLAVYEGQDMTRAAGNVYSWDAANRRYIAGTQVWDRFCSADLAAPSAYAFDGYGTTDRIFLNGDEINEGRAWAHIATGSLSGTSWHLPRLGRCAYENAVACPNSGAKTMVFLMDDGALAPSSPAADNPSEVYLYIGSKQSDGSPIEKAGLTNGKLYGLKVMRGATRVTEESNTTGLGDATTGYVSRARFELIELGDDGDVSAMSGLQLSQDSIANGAMRFQRAEDGAWDPRPSNKGDFYFLTTASITNNSRLWRIRFDNLDNPVYGGTIEILLTASEGRMFDNMCVDKLGRVLIQEDTGNDPYISKIRMYVPSTGLWTEIAHHDPELFQSGINAAKFITQDEESSGIIDASDILGQGWFLGDVQVHKAHPDPELVEYGQLFAMWVDPAIR